MTLDLSERLEVHGLEAFLADVHQFVSQTGEVLVRGRHRYRALEQVVVAIAALVSRCERRFRGMFVPVSETEWLYSLVKKGRHVLFVLLGSAHGVFEGETSAERSVSAGIGVQRIQLLRLEFNGLVKVKLRQLEFRFVQDLHSLD